MSIDTVGGPSGVGHESAAPFDVGGYLRRARRLADVSQRELALLAGVAQSTLARWESGEREPTASMLAQLLGAAGLRLEVVDEADRRVRPFDRDTVRDNAGRSFPAHLDVLPPDLRPGNRGYGERYDRPKAKGWYALRTTRDEQHPRPGRPTDHPTVAELSARRERRREELRQRARDRVVPRPPPPPCTCFDDCYEHPACPASCPASASPPTVGCRWRGP